VGIIKSQKAIANTQNLCENFERKKITKREENFTITMVITSGLLWCVRVPEFNWSWSFSTLGGICYLYKSYQMDKA